MIDVRRVETLRLLARHRSFSAAAEALGYTQSAVSQQISALERELGFTLVERGLRPVRLTDAGATVVELAGPVFEGLASLEAGLDALRGLKRGRLRLAGFHSACLTLAGRALATFIRDHPGIETELIVAEPPEATQLLRAGDADLAIVYDEPEAPGLERTPLLEDPFVLVLPRDHRLARRRALELGELAGERWISPARSGPSATYRAMLERISAEAGFEPRVAHETEDVLVGQALVAAGLGLALMPRLALGVTHPGVTLGELRGGPRRRVWAARVNDRRSPAADAMLEVLRDLTTGPPA